MKFTWEYLPYPNIYSSQLNVATKDGLRTVNESSKQFLSADLNGDGVSDIIRLSSVGVTNSIKNGRVYTEHLTHIYISKSRLSSTGSVTYDSPLIYKEDASISNEQYKYVLGGTSVMDFDGDGYNDLIIPFQNVHTGHWNETDIHVISGSDVVAERMGIRDSFSVQIQSIDKCPLLLGFDVDGNGKDDVVCIGQHKKDNYYLCAVVRHVEGNVVDFTVLNFSLPPGVNKDIEKAFVGDYNNDGLSDIILLYEGGYKIYFNNGGTATEIASRFTESNTKSGTDFGNCWRIQQGDFDGDGLSDFVYYKAGQTFLCIARNNGDGTFTCAQSFNLGFGDHAAANDDTRFSLMAYDADHDGRSDVMVCKSGYEHHGALKFRNEYTNTQVRWFYSTGTGLQLAKSLTKTVRMMQRKVLFSLAILTVTAMQSLLTTVVISFLPITRLRKIRLTSTRLLEFHLKSVKSQA